MPTGTVKWFNAQKGYGFIQPAGNTGDVFVHISAVERAGWSGLNEGQTVTFDLEPGLRATRAAVNPRTESQRDHAGPTGTGRPLVVLLRLRSAATCLRGGIGAHPRAALSAIRERLSDGSSEIRGG